MNANALFDSATASLKYAQAGLLVTAQNVSGATTDGFVRRTPESLLGSYSAEAARPGQGIDGFGRNYSAFLQRQMLRQAGETAYTRTLSTSTATLDRMLTDEATAIGSAMGAFFNAAGSLANEPSNPAYRESLIGSARQLSSRINTAADVLQTMREDSARGLEDTLRQANDVMGQLGRVNAQIVNTPTPDLFDERDRLGMELQRLIGGTSVLEGDGTLSHQIGGIMVVEGSGAYQFTNSDGTQPLVVRQPLADNVKLRAPAIAAEGGKIIDVFQRQQAGSNLAERSFIDRGQAGAYITLLNEQLPAWQRSLDLMAADLVRQANKVRGSGGQIQPLFSFGGVTLDPGAIATSMGLVERGVPNASPPAATTALTLTQATTTSVKGYAVFRNGVDTGAKVESDARNGALTLSSAITYSTSDTIEFQSPADYLKMLESIQLPVRAISSPAPATTAASATNTLVLGSATASPVTNYKLFINGQDSGALVLSEAASFTTPPPAPPQYTLALDKAVTYSSTDRIEFRYPFNSSLYSSLADGDFNAANLRVQATSQDSQFVNFDAGAAKTLSDLRATFEKPVTAFTSRIASTLGGWNSELKLNETLERSLGDQKASISGVNLDEEAANLVRYQQLYAAASKMVQMGSQMFDTLLAMMSGR